MLMFLTFYHSRQCYHFIITNYLLYRLQNPGTSQPSCTQKMQKSYEYVSSYYGLIVIELFNLQFPLIYEENVLSIF